jgi:hypothetical protein
VIGVSAGSTLNTSVTSRIRVYNNTFFNIAGYNCGIYLCENGQGPYSENTVYNNIWMDCCPIIPTGLSDSDYNDYYHMGEVTGGPHDGLLTGDPFAAAADGDFQLAGATQAGTPLEAPYDRDMYGNTRGMDGNWDRGAYEY